MHHFGIEPLTFWCEDNRLHPEPQLPRCDFAVGNDIAPALETAPNHVLLIKYDVTELSAVKCGSQHYMFHPETESFSAAF